MWGMDDAIDSGRYAALCDIAWTIEQKQMRDAGYSDAVAGEREIFEFWWKTHYKNEYGKERARAAWHEAFARIAGHHNRSDKTSDDYMDAQR